jgi:hypothetical protein
VSRNASAKLANLTLGLARPIRRRKTADPRAAVLARLWALVADPATKPSQVISACRVLLAHDAASTPRVIDRLKALALDPVARPADVVSASRLLLKLI